MGCTQIARSGAPLLAPRLRRPPRHASLFWAPCPTAPPTSCPAPGCPELTFGGRCPKHRAEAERPYRQTPEAKARKKIYNSRRGAGVRRTVLSATPWCAVEGCQELATEVDHVLSLADGGDPWSAANLQALCHRHHAEKTARETFGRVRNG